MGEFSFFFFERIDVVVQMTLGAILNDGPNNGRRRRSASKVPFKAPNIVWRAKIHVRDHRGRVLPGLSLSIERIPMKPNGQKIFREYITDDNGAIVIRDLCVPELTREGVEVVVNNDIFQLKRISFHQDREGSSLLVGELKFTEEEMRYYALL